MYVCMCKTDWILLVGFRFRHNPNTREYSPKVAAVAAQWWEEQFPTKSEFEL